MIARESPFKRVKTISGHGLLFRRVPLSNDKLHPYVTATGGGKERGKKSPLPSSPKLGDGNFAINLLITKSPRVNPGRATFCTLSAHLLDTRK